MILDSTVSQIKFLCQIDFPRFYRFWVNWNLNNVSCDPDLFVDAVLCFDYEEDRYNYM